MKTKEAMRKEIDKLKADKEILEKNVIEMQKTLNNCKSSANDIKKELGLAGAG